MLISSACSIIPSNYTNPDDPDSESEQSPFVSDYNFSEPSIDLNTSDSFVISDFPEYIGLPYSEINNNTPFFRGDDFDPDLLFLSELDDLGRCGQVSACIGPETMPTEERQGSGMVKPSGWHTVKYPDIIPDQYLYNRCHLLGYQLSGINSDTRNLITGTRYMNINGMLPFEDKLASYIRNTGNHVIYRVTPVFEADNLVASGVLLEAVSFEDKGKSLMFCAFCYNVQPGIIIDYSSGESEAQEDESEIISSPDFIINVKSKKIHFPDCSSVSQMNEKNKLEFRGDIQDLIYNGYLPCKECNPNGS